MTANWLMSGECIQPGYTKGWFTGGRELGGTRLHYVTQNGAQFEIKEFWDFPFNVSELWLTTGNLKHWKQNLC